jgi:hypothetical protein
VIQIYAGGELVREYRSPEEMAREAACRFNIGDRVAGAKGTAFDLMEWYRSLEKQVAGRLGGPPSRLRAEASDDFQAVIPWEQLDQGAFLFEREGRPLRELRLYVPRGSSGCLNVKNVRRLVFLTGEGGAVYGFKTIVRPEDLRKI